MASGSVIKRSPFVDSALHIIKGAVASILRIPTGVYSTIIS